MLRYFVSRFLLAFLSIETILQERTIYRRRQRLGEMQDSLNLGGAYGTTLARIKAQDEEKARLGMAVLMWISHSRRPLRVDEIRHALAVRIGSNDLDYDDIPGISTMLVCCQGLVTIDKGTSTIRLIHFTLQEHLRTHPDLFDRAHSTIAETCLTYLNFQHVTDLSSSTPDHRGTPFLEYSSLYWGTHMRAEPSDRAEEFALQLLDQFESHISAGLLWEWITKESPNPAFRLGGTSTHGGFSALHCISYFGIPQVANTLLEMNKWGVNQRDGAGVTPLIWAASCGHEEVVELLLQQKHIQPDKHDTNYDRTALSWAAGNGHEGVVRLLLGPRFVNPGRIGRLWGKAARAAGILSSRRHVNPNSSSESDRAPLLLAAADGNEGIGEPLLGRGHVNPNRSSWGSRTPLSWAAGNGHEGIVELLLGREDVGPNGPVHGSCTPLWLAAGNGHQGIVKLLLGREDVYPNGGGWENSTPLARAAGNGHEGIVKLLLGRGDVNPDIPDRSFGQTPLVWATENGHEGIVGLLLERKDVNPNGLSKSGCTPLLLAARKGHAGIAELLLGRGEVNPNTPDTKFREAPLLCAAGNGYEGIVKLLLDRKDIHPDPSNIAGETPLMRAAETGREEIVKLLLAREDVDPNSHSKSGQTPLMLADKYGHDGVVELLQARPSSRIP